MAKLAFLHALLRFDISLLARVVDTMRRISRAHFWPRFLYFVSRSLLLRPAQLLASRRGRRRALISANSSNYYAHTDASLLSLRKVTI